MSKTDPIFIPRNTADSEACPPSTSRRRPQQLELFSTEDVENPLPSPPYRRVASQTYLHPYPEESPAYNSQSRLDLSTELSRMVEENEDQHPPSDKESEHIVDLDEHKPSAKTARFREDVQSPLATIHPLPSFVRAETFESTRSRSPSIADTDDERDDYDWSGEEDLVDEEAKFEQNMGVAKKESWGFRKFMALVFGSLLGSTIMSAVLVAPALLIHFFWYKPHPSDHRRYVKDNVEAWMFWAAANLTISWYLAVIIDAVPIFVRYLISIIWGHVSESVKSRTELYTSVKDTLKPLFYAASAWVSWVIIFAHIYKLYDMDDASKSRAQYTERLYDVVEFVFFFSLVICGQQMLSHAIAFAFHRTAYRERLDKVQETLRVLERLRAYRPKRSHIKSSSMGFGSRSLNALNFANNFGHGSRPGSPAHSRATTPSNSHPPSPTQLSPIGQLTPIDHDTDGEPTKSKGKSKARHVSDWFSHTPSPQHFNSDHSTPQRHTSEPMSPHRYPPNTPRRRKGSEDDTAAVLHGAATAVAKTLRTAVLHDARNLEGRIDPDLGGLGWNISSPHEAKRLARSIFSAFRSVTRTYLIPSDFFPAFKTHEEAEEAFRVFDKDNNGDLSRTEIKSTLVKVYKERRSLSRSMRDVSQALKSLNQILLAFAMVILFFISLSVFGVNVGDSLTSVYSLGIGLSFIFKNSASNAFDAIMFLFVTHPFDTGDRCFIDDENLVVKKMGLFATVFARADGTESYYFNSQLFSKFITNARRSGKTAENLTMQVHWRTPLEKLDALEKCMNDWLSTEQNRWFEPSTSVSLQNINYMRHLEITIGIGHNGNWQDWGLRLTRKTAFHAAVNYFCRQLGIEAYESPLPIAWVDQDTHDIDGYPGEEDYDNSAEYDQDAPILPQRPEEVHRPTCLGFQPPPDKPMPGIRARKSKHRKALLRTVGADG